MIEIEEKYGWIIGGGGGGAGRGAKGMFAPPPSQIIGGACSPPLFLRLCVKIYTL